MTQREQLIEMLEEARVSFYEDGHGGVNVAGSRFLFGITGRLTDVEGRGDDADH